MEEYGTKALVDAGRTNRARMQSPHKAGETRNSTLVEDSEWDYEISTTFT
jgi:hypothetical protein